MEKSKDYRVLVQQVDWFSYEFSVSATSEASAKSAVEKLIEEEPLDRRRDTYDSTALSMEIVDTPIQAHTVKSLFNIDKDITDEEVISVDDLSEKQKTFLRLVREDDTFIEPAKTLFVFSSGGSFKVDAENGLVVECTTDRK